MTNIPIIDSHIHQWDLKNTPRKPSPLVKVLGWSPRLMMWLARKVFPRKVVEFFGEPDHLLTNYLPADFAADFAQANVTGFVHVEAEWKGKKPLDSVDETRWLEGLGSPLLLGIIGRADLSMGADVDAVLEAHLAASPKFRGIRVALSHHGSPRVMNGSEQPALSRDAQWRAGFERLNTHNLTFDATIYHNQLHELTELARAFPETPIVLCHAGTPVGYAGPFADIGQSAREREAVAAEWREGMAALAECPNVVVKISGLAMPVIGWGYHEREEAPSVQAVVADYQPLITFMIDTFGADRCMFASNFPIDKISLSWKTLYEVFAACVADRPEEERAALFSGTAKRVYRL